MPVGKPSSLRLAALALPVLASACAFHHVPATPPGLSAQGGSGAGDATLTLEVPAHGDTRPLADTRAPSCAEGGGAADQRFVFVPPADGYYRFHVRADYDSVLSVRGTLEGDLACNDDAGSKRESEVVVPLRGGEPYEIVVDGYGAESGTFALVAVPSAPPVPDGREGVLTLAAPAAGRTVQGEEHYSPRCGAASPGGDHVWHFVPDATGRYRFHVSADYDSVLAVVDERQTELACNDDHGQVSESEVVVELEAGHPYGVVVDGYRGAVGAYRLVADAVAAPPPPPAPGSAGPGGGILGVGQPVRSDTRGSVDRFAPSCGSHRGSPDDVWELTATEALLLELEVNAEFDSVVAVFDDAGLELGCNDDSGEVSHSVVSVGLAPGRTYRVVVDGYSGATGAYELVARPTTGGAAPGAGPATPPAPPPPAVPTPAGPLPLRRAIQHSTVGSTDQRTPSCGSRPGSPDDVWELTIRRRQWVTLQVDASYDSTLALYDDAGNELDCNDDDGSTSRSTVMQELSPGTYYVVVDGYAGGSGSYRLEARPGRKPRRAGAP